MYDDDQSAEYGPEDIPQPVATQLPPLKWTSRGHECSVEFRDAEDLSGKDMRRLRTITGGSENKGEQANDLYAEVLRLLIVRWDIGYAPTLSTPGEGRSAAAILEQLSALDLRRLEQYVTPLALSLARGDEVPEEGFGSPRTPARG